MEANTETSYVVELKVPEDRTRTGSASAPSSDEKRWVTTSCDRSWYPAWVKHQVRCSPGGLFASLEHSNGTEDTDFWPAFERVWDLIAQTLQDGQQVSVNDLVQRLIAARLVKRPSKEDVTMKDLSVTKRLVFSILGWQTMLYLPDIGSCVDSQLAIGDETDGHPCQPRLELRQDISICKEPLHQFLLFFGIMLPPPHLSIGEGQREQRAFHDITRIEPTSPNAHLLVSVGRMKLKWVDSLACHLEMNRPANVLYLYRWPSFCVCNLAAHDRVIPCALRACSAFDGLRDDWATPSDVQQTLKEVLLSYRILFGQTKKSRHHFKKCKAFDGAPEGCVDQLLSQLCARKQSPLAEKEVQEREAYDLKHDLPILQGRLAVLQQHLADQKPRAWRELWQDKRDSAQWFTFWAVVVIGGLGILLAFVQVVLQAVELGLGS